VKEGPAHEPVFNRKAVEQSAAEAALMEIIESIPGSKHM
jgi:hypothetical protein